MGQVTPLLLVTALMGAVSAAAAQDHSPQERREDLAKVQEMLADPDPLMRLANMEALVGSGDALKIRIAIRTAFASNDADLRGLAMRAYLATQRDITFDVSLPPAIQKQYDSATPSTMQDLTRQYPFLPSLSNAAFRVHLKLIDYTLGQDSGKVEAQGDAPFTITGDKFSTQVPVPYSGVCYIDFWPSRKLTLDGTLACGGVWPKLAITAPAS